MTRLFFSVRSIRARRDLTRDKKIRKRLGAEGAQSGAGVAPLRSPFFFPPPRAQEAQAVEPNRRRATPKKKKKSLIEIQRRLSPLTTKPTSVKAIVRRWRSASTPLCLGVGPEVRRRGRIGRRSVIHFSEELSRAEQRKQRCRRKKIRRAAPCFFLSRSFDVFEGLEK